ncbi:MAG: DUF3572 domain-containing protein [Beijerinckiaceae bacterium]
MLTHSSTSRGGKAAMSRDAAQDIAVAALGFMAQDTEIIGHFMEQVGVDPAGLRQAARSPGFLAAVLDYLCNNESQLLAFAANHGLNPQTVDSARQRLAGPEHERSV